MQRLPQTVLVVSTLLGSWLAMQDIHELGHVVGAWLTGGRVAQVVLSPLTISRTDMAHDPHPLMVARSGPVLGAAAPLLLWRIAARLRWSFAFVLRFLAGICLVANGAYIAGGSFAGVGDCGTMLRHGAARWQLWLFGALAVPLGLCLWQGQGRHFGLGSAADRVNPGIAYGSLLVLALLVVLGVCCSRWALGWVAANEP